MICGVPEVAPLFGVRSQTISRHATAGVLPFVAKLPGDAGRYLFDLAVVEKLATKALAAERSRLEADQFCPHCAKRERRRRKVATVTAALDAARRRLADHAAELAAAELAGDESLSA